MQPAVLCNLVSLLSKYTLVLVLVNLYSYFQVVQLFLSLFLQGSARWRSACFFAWAMASVLHCIHCVCSYLTQDWQHSLEWNLPVLLNIYFAQSAPPPPLPLSRPSLGHMKDFSLCTGSVRDLSAIVQKFRVSVQRRAGSSSALRVKWLCGCFRSPPPGSLPVTVLWTGSSWGLSTAKDRWQARAEKPPPPPLSTPPPALFVFLFLSASLSSLSYVTGRNLSVKKVHAFFFPAEFCSIILKDLWGCLAKLCSLKLFSDGTLEFKV